MIHGAVSDPHTVHDEDEVDDGDDDDVGVLSDSSSYTANDDAENQNFLPDNNLGKKKYETEYVRKRNVISELLRN